MDHEESSGRASESSTGAGASPERDASSQQAEGESIGEEVPAGGSMREDEEEEAVEDVVEEAASTRPLAIISVEAVVEEVRSAHPSKLQLALLGLTEDEIRRVLKAEERRQEKELAGLTPDETRKVLKTEAKRMEKEMAERQMAKAARLQRLRQQLAGGEEMRSWSEEVEQEEQEEQRRVETGADDSTRSAVMEGVAEAAAEETMESEGGANEVMAETMDLDEGTNEGVNNGQKRVYGREKGAGVERALMPGEWNQPLDRGEWAQPANGRRTRIERAPGWDAPGIRRVDLVVGKEAKERATQVEMSKEATLRKKEVALGIPREVRAGSKRNCELGEPWGRKEKMISIEELNVLKKRRREERANEADRKAAGRRELSRDSGVEVSVKRRRIGRRERQRGREEGAKETPAASTSARGGERGQLEAGSQGRSGRSERGEEERSRAAKEERDRKDKEARDARGRRFGVVATPPQTPARPSPLTSTPKSAAEARQETGAASTAPTTSTSTTPAMTTTAARVSTTTTTTTTATTASGRVPILPPTQSPVGPSTSGFKTPTSKAPRGGGRGRGNSWRGRGSGRGSGRGGGGRTDIWMEEDWRIQLARQRRTEEEVDEDRDFDEWRTDPEMRFVVDRCMARREKEKEKRREEKEKERKKEEEKKRKKDEEWMEEYRNRPGGAEEREERKKSIMADRERCKDFGAPAPRSEPAERQRQKSPAKFAAVDCRKGVTVFGGEECETVQETKEQKKRKEERERELKKMEKWEEQFLRNEAELSRSAKSPAAMFALKRFEKSRRLKFFEEKKAEQELERKRREEQEQEQEYFVIKAPRQTSLERSRREERTRRESEREERGREEPFMDDTNFAEEAEERPTSPINPHKYKITPLVAERREEVRCTSYEDSEEEDEEEDEGRKEDEEEKGDKDEEGKEGEEEEEEENDVGEEDRDPRRRRRVVTSTSRRGATERGSEKRKKDLKEKKERAEREKRQRQQRERKDKGQGKGSSGRRR